MKKINNFFRKMFGISITFSLISLVFGLILVLDTESILTMVSIILGWTFLIIGGYFCLRYFMNKEKLSNIQVNFELGTILVILGLILLIFNNIFYILIPLLIAVIIIINSINKIDLSLIMKRDKIEKWYISLIIGVITLMAGICLLINPLGGTFLVTKVVGIVIIVSSILDLIDTFNIKIKVKKTGKKLKEIFIKE